MTTRLAIVAYRCEVGGIALDSLDIQVRYFDDPTLDIRSFLHQEAPQSYSNNSGELVTWPFVDVLAVEDLGNPENGKEVVGFIAGCEEFAKWTQK